MKRTVIIPALNPDSVLLQITREVWERKNLVIVVDDGSDPSCQKLFETISETCVVLHHPENRGKGEAIRTALDYIRKELWDCSLIGIMDADGQHLPQDMDRLLDAAGSHPRSLVLGVRSAGQDMPLPSRIGSRITRAVFRTVTGADVSDTQTGLRAFSADLLDIMYQVSGSRYEYETNVLLACVRRNIPILEIPIATIYHDRSNSCSHFRKIRDSARIYGGLFKFALSSLSSFFLDYGLFAGFTLLLPHETLSILGANVAARLISAFYNYKINCRFVFREKQEFRTAADYAALALLILVMNQFLLTLFLRVLPVYPAKLATELSLFLISWIVQKHVIFHHGIPAGAALSGGEPS